MIFHLVPEPEWSARPASGYAPASLATEGFVHCSPDDATTLAVAAAFYRGAPRPLLVLGIDPDRLTSRCVAEPAAPAPPPGVDASTLFPHVYGPVDDDAVVDVREVRWPDDGTPEIVER
ncbi:DUF952 domain-containing protein [Solicola sp. PLA-1-18]|uniref:DUF952 domain-containing protein n=1 Tax=Solicola sp. PLA-1-18 TaxID=3380532 RepID=UPI003B7FC375